MVFGLSGPVLSSMVTTVQMLRHGIELGALALGLVALSSCVTQCRAPIERQPLAYFTNGDASVFVHRFSYVTSADRQRARDADREWLGLAVLPQGIEELKVQQESGISASPSGVAVFPLRVADPDLASAATFYGLDGKAASFNIAELHKEVLSCLGNPPLTADNSRCNSLQFPADCTEHGVATYTVLTNMLQPGTPADERFPLQPFFCTIFDVSTSVPVTFRAVAYVPLSGSAEAFLVGGARLVVIYSASRQVEVYEIQEMEESTQLFRLRLGQPEVSIQLPADPIGCSDNAVFCFDRSKGAAGLTAISLRDGAATPIALVAQKHPLDSRLTIYTPVAVSGEV